MFLEVIEIIVEAVCKLLVTLIWLLLSIVAATLKWLLLSIVCLLQALCPVLVLVGATALVIALVSLVALAAPAIGFAGAAFATTAALALGALALALSLCEVGFCRIVRAVGWALKWSIVIGAAIAMVTTSPLSGLVVAIFGGLIAALVIATEGGSCKPPKMMTVP